MSNIITKRTSGSKFKDKEKEKKRRSSSFSTIFGSNKIHNTSTAGGAGQQQTSAAAVGVNSDTEKPRDELSLSSESNELKPVKINRSKSQKFAGVIRSSSLGPNASHFNNHKEKNLKIYEKSLEKERAKTLLSSNNSQNDHPKNSLGKSDNIQRSSSRGAISKDLVIPSAATFKKREGRNSIIVHRLSGSSKKEKDILSEPSVPQAENNSNNKLLNEFYAVIKISKISEEDIWQGKQRIIPLFKHFNKELKVELYPQSAVNFHFPILPEFEGVSLKMFRVDRRMPVQRIITMILARIPLKEVLNPSLYSLSTLDGVVIPDSHPLAIYGLGSILQNWELKIIKIPPQDLKRRQSKANITPMIETHDTLIIPNQIQKVLEENPEPDEILSQQPIEKNKMKDSIEVDTQINPQLDVEATGGGELYSVLVIFTHSLTLHRVLLPANFTTQRIIKSLWDKFENLSSYDINTLKLTTLHNFEILEDSKTLSDYGLGTKSNKITLQLIIVLPLPPPRPLIGPQSVLRSNMKLIPLFQLRNKPHAAPAPPTIEQIPHPPLTPLLTLLPPPSNPEPTPLISRSATSVQLKGQMKLIPLPQLNNSGENKENLKNKVISLLQMLPGTNNIPPPPSEPPPQLPETEKLGEPALRKEIAKLQKDLENAKAKEAELMVTNQKTESRAKKLRNHMGQQNRALQQQATQDKLKLAKMKELMEEALTELDNATTLKLNAEREKHALNIQIQSLNLQLSIQQPSLPSEASSLQTLVLQLQKELDEERKGKQELKNQMDAYLEHRKQDSHRSLSTKKHQREAQQELSQKLSASQEAQKIVNQEKLALEAEITQLKLALEASQRKKEHYRRKLADQFSIDDNNNDPIRSPPSTIVYEPEPSIIQLSDQYTSPKIEERELVIKETVEEQSTILLEEHTSLPSITSSKSQETIVENTSSQVPVPQQQEVRQWAWDVIDVSSEAGRDPSDDWGSRQILGPPRVAEYGDSGNAWAPLETNAGHEWITLRFKRRLFISEILILESWHPGAVYKVEVLAPDGKWETVWETIPKVEEEVLRIVQANPAQPLSYPSDAVKIHLNSAAVSDEWNEIAAVQVAGLTVAGDPEPPPEPEAPQKPLPKPSLQPKKKPADIKNEFEDLNIYVPPDRDFSLNLLTNDILEAGKIRLRGINGDHWAQRTKEEILLITGETPVEEIEPDVDVMSALQKRFDALHGVQLDQLEDTGEWNDDWEDTKWGDDEDEIFR